MTSGNGEGAAAREEADEVAVNGRAAQVRLGRAAVGVDGHRAVEPFGAAIDGSGISIIGVAAAAASVGATLGVVALLGLPIAVGLGESADHVIAQAAAFGAGWMWAAMLTPGLIGSTRWGREVVPGAGLLILVALVLVGTSLPIGGMALAGLAAGILLTRLTTVVAGLHPAARVRSLAIVRLGIHLGVAVAAGMVALVTAGDGDISGVVVGLTALPLAGLTLGFDLGAGEDAPEDVTRIRRAASPVEGGAVVADMPLLGALRRLFAAATFRAVLVGYLGVGVVLVAWHVHLVRFLTIEWGLSLWGRGAVYAATAVAALAATWLAAGAMESWYRADPDRVARATTASLLAGGLGLVVLAPWPAWGGAFIAVVALAMIAVAWVGLDVLLVATTRPSLRGRAVSLGTAATGGGLLLGAGILWGAERWNGASGAIGVAGAAAVIAGLALQRTNQAAAHDLETAVSDEFDASVLAVLLAGDDPVPLLDCRNLDFSYGSVQVLFGVDFTVDTGEMVALLGTNGAGKSTLLRVISGLGLPSRGSVRLRGEDITYFDPAARVARGVSQVPGGRAVFGPLTVAENLRVFGYSLGRDHAAVDRGIETAFEAFPRLDERRNLPASILSGGERQMLALTKALILEPELLLIDELSLGLAPTVVAQLLDMVREINARGTAVVLVEQSVNVALSLVDHAYYMEKGEIRFDGPAEQLLERGDLLRSAYLEGAAKGLGS